MTREVFVLGVGMTKFERPGSRAWDYPEMAREAASAALADAGIGYERIQQVVAGYVYGESTSGQRGVYELGLTGVPVYNVNNNCSTGSTALLLARQLVSGGAADCVLAVGFEKMQRGSLTLGSEDRAAALGRHLEVLQKRGDVRHTPIAPQMFADAAREHMGRYGTTLEQLGLVAVKNHRHSVNNPFAQFRDEFTLEQVLSSKVIDDPLTLLQCSPTSDGSAAAVVACEEIVCELDAAGRAVEIIGQAMATDFPSSFDGSIISMIGADLSAAAARQVYEQTGFGPEDVQVIELHDCFSPNEIITYEALGLCAAGKGGDLVASGATTYGGRWVVNPSGGLISKGHPLGATGLAQCAELTWQLRCDAGDRQVDGATRGLQHNIGLGGAAVVTMYAAPSRT